MNVEPSMSEFDPSHSPDPAPAAPDNRHGGALLREQRMASGMHIVGLSAVLKVPVARLEALEAGRFDELPDLIFARALAASVCRVLKIDATPILAALPLPPAPAQVASSAAVEPSQPLRPHTLPMGGHAAHRRRRFWVALLLLVVLALLASGAWWWQQPITASAEAPAPVQEASAALTPMLPPADAPAIPLSAEVPAVASSDQLAPVDAAQPPVLRLSVTSVSWVQLLGATGALRMERTLQPGESIEISDDLPLQVVVGRADAVDVQVRGQPFDLAPYTRNQVARFEVR